MIYFVDIKENAARAVKFVEVSK